MFSTAARHVVLTFAIWSAGPNQFLLQNSAQQLTDSTINFNPSLGHDFPSEVSLAFNFDRNDDSFISSSNDSRGLQQTEYVQGQTYPFFETTPYVSTVVIDSHDDNCDLNTGSPPNTVIGSPGYPSDGTDALRQLNMACGIAPARFVFFTSDLLIYSDTSVDANMQVRITCTLATFIESLTCENLLDATGNFPSILGCRFLGHEARFTLATRLAANTAYSLTMKLIMPPGKVPASQNSFVLTTEFEPQTVIEGTRAPVDIGYTVPNAKDESVWGKDYTGRGYLTGFSWQPDETYKADPGVESTFTFGIRTFGRMDNKYVIDVVGHPTNVWKLGDPDSDCKFYSMTWVGTTCVLKSFQGALASEANGFQIKVGTTPFLNLGLDSTQTIKLNLVNPPTAVNMYWTATSYLRDQDQLPQMPYTVMVDKPINVRGVPYGRIVAYDYGAVNIEQWVTLEFMPGNTMMPDKGTSGILVIIPPGSFSVIVSSPPQPADSKYNEPPCTSWPAADRAKGRWICKLTDQALFKQTAYRIMLKVRNPPVSGAAKTWRVELWQQGGSKPIAITRAIRGMEVTGPMIAAVSQQNQLLGSMNSLELQFQPSQPIGTMNFTQLQVIAPPGFVILKRCVGFMPIQLPAATCKGSNSNTFAIIFRDAGAIIANLSYSFSLQVQNPTTNVLPSENVWSFTTTRPDGVSVDSARYNGFFLYPYDFASFLVLPSSRKVGSQRLVIRFTSTTLIPFDDFIRVRAPDGFEWDSNNLKFTTDTAITLANAIQMQMPTVDVLAMNTLVAQLVTNAQAKFEYGFAANCNIPLSTPLPNQWWIEQYRRTGLPPPNSWTYIASRGTPGFKTQALVNADIQPFNLVAEGWNNPTMFVFETTMEVLPVIKSTAAGTKLVYPIFHVIAPAMFTYICPLSKIINQPAYTTLVPDDVNCIIDHTVESDRNKLTLEFPSGIKANTRYVFTVNVVNAPYTDPTKNEWYLATMLAGDVMEDAFVFGYSVANRMDNTRYVFSRNEDRRVEAASNVVSFIIGTTTQVTLDSILEVKAPVGFRFDNDCTSKVGTASWINGMLTLPTILVCQGLGTVSPDKMHIAQIQMTGTWFVGNYGLFVTVQNPMFTPSNNFWGFTIRDRLQTPLMSESWVYGFQIQVVLNPMLRAYNMGNGVDGEAAINYVDISFVLSTRIQPSNSFFVKLVVTASNGFRFPNICRGFQADTGTPGYSGLPAATTCSGNGAAKLTLTLPMMYTLSNATQFMFRFLVINPRETFTNVNDPNRWWRIETFGQGDNMVDLNRVIPSFPIYQRLRYFNADTLSQVGLNSTTFQFLFRTDQPLPPQQTVEVSPPFGITFNGLKNGACIDEDPVLISRRFKAPLKAVTQLPEWVSCTVLSPTLLRLRNEEPILGGRPLISGPVFQFFLKNGTNAQSTPPLNVFTIKAYTSTPNGIEVWTAPGWTIFPQLGLPSVATSNPGYGLYTNFTFKLQVITQVPPGGSIRFTAPYDYYFGPLIENDQNRYNPLQARPPPQGACEERPDPSTVVTCDVLRTPNWNCPFEFDPCIRQLQIQDMQKVGIVLTPGVEEERVAVTQQCQNMGAQCLEGGQLSALITCQSQANTLTLTLAPAVRIPTLRFVGFLVQGYNTRYAPPSSKDSTWIFQTRNSDSEKTTMDLISGVQGVSLVGIVSVDSMIPSNTKVSSIDNYVTITILLATKVEPRALLRIIYPSDYLRSANAAFTGPAITFGPTFPRQVQVTQSLNVIELEAVEEALPAKIPLVLTIGLSNPAMTPKRSDNVWQFEAFSSQSGSPERLNTNLNVSGFKIFGEFSQTAVIGSVISPNSRNMVGVWFNLKSALSASDTSQMNIWIAPGFVPLPDCGGALFSLTYSPDEDANKFPNTVSYFPLPSGTECRRILDDTSGLWYISLKLDGFLDYGLDYAFQFAVTNPRYITNAAQNVWRFETIQDNVILHLRTSIPGFELQQMKFAQVTPSDTTTLLPLNRLKFFIMSDKYIPGGSKIQLTAPTGFIFTCAFFNTEGGISNTATCYVRSPTFVEITTDTQDPIAPNSAFSLYIYVSNPEYTPQTNLFNFLIVNPLGVTVDIRDMVSSFDITGRIQVNINPTFPYFGQLNPVHVVFVQSTILNQADHGNEFVVTAPRGYVFPVNCSEGWGLSLSNEVAVTSNDGYDLGMTFPPEGMTCTGFGNETIVIRMPDGAGLLRNNYTLQVVATNPAYETNASTWSFITRVRNSDGERIVDANRTLDGFALFQLVPLRTDESSSITFSVERVLLVFLLATLAT